MLEDDINNLINDLAQVQRGADPHARAAVSVLCFTANQLG
jgi:hypothetical protein